VLESVNEEIKRVPFVRIILPFLAGVASASVLDTQAFLPLIFTFFLWLLLFFFWNRRKISFKYTLRWVFGTTVYGFLFFSGFSHYKIFWEAPGFRTPHKDAVAILGDVYQIPEERENTVRIFLKVRFSVLSDTLRPLNGKVLVYLEKDSLSLSVRTGDRLFLDNRFREVPPPTNPNQFNYRKYLENQRIYCQAYLRSDQWRILERNQGHILLSIAGRVREHLLSLFVKHGLKGEENAVASALILGFRGDLDQELRGSYSASGAMHVLAVSGLHVGIIYLILHTLFGFLKRFPRGDIVRALLLLLSVWFYALLTGLSPSVMRASTMFSFLIIGSALHRPPNVYNTLATSAFFLILVNPLIIHAVGFQLSYLAVLGIVFFQPKIYRLIFIRNKLLDKIWALTCVSLGAQLGTFPLTLYYFQQFPNYFLLTNLFVIPLAAMILLSGILLFVFSFWHPLAWFFSTILAWCVWFLNVVVKTIEWLPFSHTQGIYIHGLHIPLLYLLIVFFTGFLIFRRPVWLKAGLTLLLLLTTSLAWLKIDAFRQNQLIVYDSGNHLVMNYLSGKTNFILTNAEPAELEGQLDYISRAHWTRNFSGKPMILNPDQEKFIDVPEGKSILNQQHFWFFGGKTVLLPDESFMNSVPPEVPGSVDYVVIYGKSYIHPKRLLRFVKPGKVILAPSIPAWFVKRYHEDYSEADVDCHSIPSAGAFREVFR
jgi:competence protein ComEC